MTIELSAPEAEKLKPRLAVLGVGGGGGNVLRTMIKCGLTGVDLYSVNTDAQALEENILQENTTRIQIGSQITRGLGAGADPKIGKKAAQESTEEIKDYLRGINMLFISACMGGGTGTGAAPIIAQIAKEMGILTVGVVTTPWSYDGTKRMRMAEEGIKELSKCVDTLIVVPNENVFRVANMDTHFNECNEIINRTLYDGVSAISSLIVHRGRINIDFADVKTVMAFVGKATFGVGKSSGENRSIMAAEMSISNPMLDEVNLRDAQGLLISITASTEITPVEIDSAVRVIKDQIHNQECEIITGLFEDDDLGDEMIVATVATGMTNKTSREDKIVNLEESPISGEKNDQIADKNSKNDAIRSVELEVRQIPSETPRKDENYRGIEENDLDASVDKEMETDEDRDVNLNESITEPEEWENDDGVPLFKSDRFDNIDDDGDLDSQLEIPAFQRKKNN
ncbi:MAG: cell division protein FtsZ [Pseudomonadota bacterium]|nr:cell division protein FtsZ [Pseudomonadota bacterium]